MRLYVEKTMTVISYSSHLKNSEDLVTTYEETRSGFIALALEKTRRSTPMVEEARSLKALVSEAVGPKNLLLIKKIRPALLTASGLSDKAVKYLSDNDKDEAIKHLVTHYLEPAGPSFVEELVFRFLITRGDTLGGSMRNFGGILAERKLARAIIASLSLSKISFYWLDTRSKRWIKGLKDDPDIEIYIKGLYWNNGKNQRTIRYNCKVPIVNKNIDFCLLNCHYQNSSEALKEPSSYIALGELKGGIDPAGADEHWKTASKALTRIRGAFHKKSLKPYLFFIGAAIQKAMAEEIWSDLKNDELNNAANLTNTDHVVSLCRWITNI
jgi:hypothetical protein